MIQYSHFGVYALITIQDSVALILKSRGPYKGMWDLPGGKIEFGESPIAALTREVQEEVDLQLVAATILDTPSVCFSYENEAGDAITLHHLGIIFTTQVKSPEKLRQSGDDQDAAEARWFPLHEVQSLSLTPFARSVLAKNEN